MTDLNISYEDGLRLSELNGTPEGLKYQAAHIIETHLGQFVALAVVSAIGILFAMWLISMHLQDDRPRKDRFGAGEDPKRWATCIYTYKVLTPARKEERTGFKPNTNGFERYTYTEDVPMEVRWKVRPWVSLTMFIVIPALAVAVIVRLLDLALTSGIEMQMADVQAQIDTILAKYGGV